MAATLPTPLPTSPETPETPETPATVTVSRGQFIGQFAELVRDVHKRFQIPHGTAFNVVAFAYQQFDQRAEAAAHAAATAAADQEAPDA